MVTTKDIKILDIFMQEHSIPYVLTGTAGLMVHGILPDNYYPNDIDIIVLVNSKEDFDKYSSVEKILNQQQMLSGEEKNDDYGNVITFKANGIKVNAFMGGKEIHKKEANNPNNYFGGFGEEGQYTVMIIKDRPIRVSNANCIFKAKFGLKRIKDYQFAKNLVSTILNTGF